MDPGTRYRGRIIAGSHLFTSFSGTVGYKILIGDFNEANEETDFTVWLTEKNRYKAIETFEKFGIRPNDIKDEASVIALASRLAGKPVKFGTKDEEYKGVIRVKVSWIDADDGRVAVEAAPSLMLAFFHGSEPAGTAFDTNTTSDPFDIPF